MVCAATQSQRNFLVSITNDNYLKFDASITQPLKVLDANTTIMVRLYGDTTTLKDVVIEVIYVENFEEDA